MQQSKEVAQINATLIKQEGEYMHRRLISLFFCSILFSLFSGCLISQDNEIADNNSDLRQTDIQEITTTSAPTESSVNENEISRYTTTLYNKEENRVHNIETAAEKLNKTIVRPGEVFSFNETIGERTKDRGFKKASIIVDGEKKTGTGGGVCQISSTLYNAALLADMKILERHEHSRKVPYVPEGKDAAVVYGSKDFKFKNTKDYPVEILITVTDDEVQITLNKKS
jgi:vancomycin resistance protein YoaR